MDKSKSKKEIILFEEKAVRRVWRNEQWYFAIVDVVKILTDSVQPDGYIKDMRRRDEELSKGWGQIATLLPIKTIGGVQKVNCSTLQGIFRIIQSIPSSKAEPFKQWLAKVGQERLQEIQDPELATKRTRELYKLKGYSDSWIEKRMRGIAIREELTDEWKNRGAQEKKDYEILTAEISKATFGLTPIQYKKVKGLEKENLRDHMDDLELIFNMLGERATTEIHRVEDSQGFDKLRSDSQAGGDIAGNARKDLEKRLKKSVIKKDNFLKKPENLQRLS